MNENRFTGKAEFYTKFRPSYPDEFISYLYTQVGFSTDCVVADIGSGTGKLTELLLQKSKIVYGIEPNTDMRNIAESSLNSYDNFKSIAASAESTGLPDNSVDFITVAQAFHWFNREGFKTECKRVLKKHGKVVLVWNFRDAESDLVKENDLINRKYCPNFKGFTNGLRKGNPNEYDDFFCDGTCEYKTFDCVLIFSEDEFVGRNISSSYAPKENDNSYIPYVKEIRSLYEKYNKSGQIKMTNTTISYVGRV